MAFRRSSVRAPTGFTSKFDYVMVFPMEEVPGQTERIQSKEAKYCLSKMIEKNLDVFTYLSVQNDELYILITASDEILGQFADKIDFKMLLDESVVRESLAAGDAENKIAPVKIHHDPSITYLTPYSHIFGRYETNVNQRLYYQHPGQTSLFSHGVRLKLLYYLLKGPNRDGGCDLEINKLLHKKKMLSFYPLHDENTLQDLLNDNLAVTTMPWQLPFDRIRLYFGEKYALYFVFLGHYTQFLIVPAAIGLIFQLVVWGTGNFSHPVLPFFGVIICLWAIFMLEFWKGKEATKALEWGMAGFESTELDRPEFEGELIDSFIDGKPMMYFPSSEADKRIMTSVAVILAFIMLVMGVVASIYYLRFSLQSNIGAYSSTVASVLNTVQITIFNMIYQIIVGKLTDLENHRTDTQYQDSLIVKLFLFQFVNSYASFFYLAFIAEYLPTPTGTPSDFKGQCGFSNCMQPLSVNLAIIFGTRLALTNFLDVFLPYMTYTSKLAKETKGAEDKELTPAEKDYMRLPYDPMFDNIRNYADTAIQFGFMALFITALPCACFFSMVNNYFKLRISSVAMTYYYQRPIPAGAEDIGTWQTIFTIIAIISVVTNAGLICFTMNVLDVQGISPIGVMWIFIGFQWVLIAAQFVSAEIIPDIPDEVTIQLERTDFIVGKLIEHIADEDYGEVAELDESSADDVAGHSKVVCGCIKKSGKTKGLKGVKKGANLPEYPVFPYPFKKLVATGDWPTIMNKESLPELVKSNGKGGAKKSENNGLPMYPNPMNAVPAVSPMAKFDVEK